MKEELISVIIPTFNRAHCIKRAVLSVLNQTYKNIEVIVVDDASTDDTEKIIQLIIDNRLKYIKLLTNAGVSKARNKGIEIAKGKYIAFQDSDDIWHNDKLEIQYNCIQKNPEVQFVFCKYGVINNSSICIEVPEENAFNFDEEKSFFRLLLKGNKAGTPTMLIDSSLLISLHGFDESLMTMEDWDLALRIADNSKCFFVNKVLVDVFPSVDGVNKVKGEKKIYAFLCILKKFWNKYENKEIFTNFFLGMIEEIKQLSYDNKMRIYKDLYEFIPNSDFFIELLLNIEKENVARGEYIEEILKESSARAEYIEQIQKENAARGEYIEKLDKKIADMESYTKQIQSENAARGEYIEKLDKKIADMESYTKQIQSENAARGEYIEKLDKKIADMESYTKQIQSENAARGEYIEEILKESSARAEYIEQIQKENAARGEYIEKLNEYINKL